MTTRIKALIAAAALAFGGGALAQTTWTLGTGTTSGSGLSTVTVTPSGWANTGSGASVDLQKLETPQAMALYSGGLGIRNQDACSWSGCPGDYNDGVSPEHAIDNDQRYEMVLLSFSQLVNLTGFKIGWGSNDTDMTLMAYTGGGNPAGSLPNLTWGSLATNGWQLISHYGAVPVNPTNPTPTSAPANLFSSYWLIGAYNPLVGAGTCLVGGSCGTGSLDYVKLLSVSGLVKQQTPGVPEPGSIGLLTLALLGLAAVSKRRAS